VCGEPGTSERSQDCVRLSETSENWTAAWNGGEGCVGVGAPGARAEQGRDVRA
jgi:hypothetical protein